MYRLISALIILLSLSVSAQDSVPGTATSGDPFSSSVPGTATSGAPFSSSVPGTATSGGPLSSSSSSLPGLVAAGAPTEFLPVEEAYQVALEITGPQELRLYWQIADSYYLYRKRFSFKLEDRQGEVETRVQFPAGIVREDEYFGVSEVYYNFADIYLDLARTAGPATLTISSQGCADAGLCYPPRKQRFTVDMARGTIGPLATGQQPAARHIDEFLSIGPLASPAGQQQAAGPATGRADRSLSLWLALIMALVGGSILNLMPCVFPILSLKVFSFAGSSGHSRHVHGWVYAAGVVSSFVLVALLLISLRQAGTAVGWGFQLQAPRFVALLAYLFFVMGLALSGLIEIGAGLMGTGSQLANRGGYGGSFFTGVLATVVASPCTAPFMGTALGYAVTQTAPVALLVFAALGAGMAAPLLLLSYSRTLRRRMPKAGPWMETFKQLLAFPLYATAIWLLWVSGRQTSETTMAALLAGMLALALGLWLWRYRPIGRLVGVMAVLGALAIIPGSLLDRPSGSPADAATATSQQQLQALLAAGKPVLVNVTADWCITCIANEHSTLSNDKVVRALEDAGIEYLIMDWTHYNPDIAAFLARFGRNGVPLYLVYSGRSGEPPRILPQLLTPGIVLKALRAI